MSNSMVKELKKQLDREIRAKTILLELNDHVNLKDTLSIVLKHFKEISLCDGIGIRVYNGKDYPYFAYEGLPESFVMKESALCMLDPGLKKFVLPDKSFWSTQCLCSDVINDNGDRSLPFFTEHGSFFCNNLPSKNHKTKTRKCIFFGYKSMAILRIMCQNQCLGLIQMFANKPIFNYELMTYLESIASYIGMAVYNNITYTKMKESWESLKGLVPMCARCKKVGLPGEAVQDTEVEKWQNIEEFLERQTGLEFTHTICPNCLEELYPELVAKMNKRIVNAN